MEVTEALTEIRDMRFDSESSLCAKQFVKMYWLHALYPLNTLMPIASLLDILMWNYSDFLWLNIHVFANKLTLNLAVILDIAINLAEELGSLKHHVYQLRVP